MKLAGSACNVYRMSAYRMEGRMVDEASNMAAYSQSMWCELLAGFEIKIDRNLIAR